MAKTEKKRRPPTPKTLKRLFSLSGNQCARPKCPRAIVNDKGTVIGRVCHIVAAEDDGPRADPKISPQEGRGFENLILLCANCHIVIDEEEKTYTVKKLKGWKAKHEARFTAIEEKLATAYLEEIANEADATDDTLPKSLAGFSKHLEGQDMVHLIDDDAPKEIAKYVQRLKNVTKNDRQLMVAIIEKCFNLDSASHYSNGIGAHPDDLRTILIGNRPLSYGRMKRLGSALERNKIGSLDPDGEDTTLYINSAHQDLDWFQLSEYLASKGEGLDALIMDMNFALLD